MAIGACAPAAVTGEAALAVAASAALAATAVAASAAEAGASSPPLAAGTTPLDGLAAWCQLLAAGGVCYHLYNQASYMVLDQGISPVTFSGAGGAVGVMRGQEDGWGDCS